MIQPQMRRFADRPDMVHLLCCCGAPLRLAVYTEGMRCEICGPAPLPCSVIAALGWGWAVHVSPCGASVLWAWGEVRAPRSGAGLRRCVGHRSLPHLIRADQFPRCINDGFIHKILGCDRDNAARFNCDRGPLTLRWQDAALNQR